MRRLAVLLVVMVAAACECVGPGLTALVPAIEAAPSPVDFGVAYVGYEERSVVRLSSSGGAPLAIEQVLVRGEGFRLADPSAAVVLQPGQAHEVVLVVVPVAAGALAGELEIVSDARDAPVLMVPLVAAAQIPPACDDLGPCLLGSFDPLTGACGFDALEGACDDGSGCTSSTRRSKAAASCASPCPRPFTSRRCCPRAAAS